MSEKALIEDLKGLDPTRFKLVYDHYSDVVYGLVLRIVRDEESADRLLQSVFVHIWQRSAEYNTTNGSLLRWMLGIAARDGVDFLQQQRDTNNLFS